MTRQEAFDRVVQGLAAQNWVPATDTFLCGTLRAEDGCRCALGHLLTDTQIDERHYAIGRGYDSDAAYTAYKTGAPQPLCEALMRVHEAAVQDGRLRERMMQLAKHLGLEFMEAP